MFLLEQTLGSSSLTNCTRDPLISQQRQSYCYHGYFLNKHNTGGEKQKTLTGRYILTNHQRVQYLEFFEENILKKIVSCQHRSFQNYLSTFICNGVSLCAYLLSGVILLTTFENELEVMQV